MYKEKYIATKGIYIPREVLKIGNISGDDKLVLSVIWYLIEYGKFTYAFPTNKSLQISTGLNSVDIDLCLENLKELGHIKIKPHPEDNKRMITIPWKK